MQRELQSTIEINAPAERVWTTLTDFNSYPEWNPFIQSIEGDVREGAALKVRIAPPGGRAMTFKPTVTAVESGRLLRWLGRLLVPGVVDGEHSFRIESLGERRTRFTQSERFSGILVRFIGNTLARTEQGFAQMNEALKQRAEEDRGTQS
jgi:hypothetical protein